MEKSRQRPPYPEIIDDPSLKTRSRIFWETVVTLGFWGVILYLLQFFLSFLLWVFSVHLMHQEIYELGNPEMLRLFRNAGWLTSIIVLLTILWSYYNLMLFRLRGERRRRQMSICFDKDLASFFKVDLEVLEKSKDYSRLAITQQEDAVLITEITP